MSSGGFAMKHLMTNSVSVDLLCVCQHDPLPYFMCPELFVLFCLKVHTAHHLCVKVPFVLLDVLDFLWLSPFCRQNRTKDVINTQNGMLDRANLMPPNLVRHVF